MNDVDKAARPAPPNVKTVQEYIDELPVWSDGTSLKSTPMTGMQWRIWTLAAFGKFFEGFVVFMGGVTVPLINREFHLAAAGARPRHLGEPCGHPGRHHHARRPRGLFRPQAHVHRRDDHLLRCSLRC